MSGTSSQMTLEQLVLDWPRARRARRGSAPRAHRPMPRTATDPVCHMDVEIAAVRHTAEHQGVTYYFCCPHCKMSFERDPARYLAATGTA